MDWKVLLQQILNAYKNSLSTHHLPSDPAWQIYSGFDISDGEAAMSQLLANKHDIPTAVIGINDMVAIGAIKECERRNRDLSDFSFVGFDNTNTAEISNPRLTSVSHCYKELGRVAVDLLLDSKSNKNDVNEVEIIPELVIRDSCHELQRN